MAHQHHTAKHDTPPWSEPNSPPPVTNFSIFATIDRRQMKPRLTRAILKRQSGSMDWQLSEYKQLNQYHAQGVFGDPIKRPPKCNLLPLILTYLIKTDETKKARCVCNEPPSQRGSVTLAHTYATALNQADLVIFGRSMHSTIIRHTALTPPMPLRKPHLLRRSPLRHNRYIIQILAGKRS